MNEEIIHADKGLRRRSAFLTIVLVAVGLWILKLSKDYLSDLATLVENDPKEVLSKLTVLAYFWAAFFAAGFLATTGYLLWLGIRIINIGRFPLPGMRVLRDTRIVRGRKARLRALVAIAAALALFVAGSAVLVTGGKVMSGLVEKTLEKSELYRKWMRSGLSK